MSETLTADEIIAHHKLEPHPEGGWFRETFRDEPGHGDRPHSTAILFLLKSGEVSHWHRVDAVEIWHWYGGAPLELQVADDKGTRRVYKLGPDIAAGEHPQAPVPAGAWQSARSLGARSLGARSLGARSLGEWTLVGCTVAPGFDFAGFELAPEGFEP